MSDGTICIGCPACRRDWYEPFWWEPTPDGVGKVAVFDYHHPTCPQCLRPIDDEERAYYEGLATDSQYDLPDEPVGEG